MYTQQEASLLRQRFWVSFGKYMAPIPSSIGEKVNWMNYRTGNKFIQFKMDAEKEGAYIGIEVAGKDHALQEMYFNHFKTFRQALENDFLEEKWEWDSAVNEKGLLVSRIFKRTGDLNIYNEKDWPALISFLKSRMIALDKFWNEYKEIFEML